MHICESFLFPLDLLIKRLIFRILKILLRPQFPELEFFLHLSLLLFCLSHIRAIFSCEFHEYIILLSFRISSSILLFLNPILSFPHLLKLFKLLVFFLGVVCLKEITMLKVFYMNLAFYFGQITLELFNGKLQVSLILAVSFILKLLLVVTHSAEQVNLYIGKIHTSKLSLFHSLSEFLMYQLVYLVCIQVKYSSYLISFKLHSFLGNGRLPTLLTSSYHLLKLLIRWLLVGDQCYLELSLSLTSFQNKILASFNL